MVEINAQRINSLIISVKYVLQQDIISWSGKRDIRPSHRLHSCHFKPAPVQAEQAISEQLIFCSLGKGDNTVLFYFKLNFTIGKDLVKRQETEKGQDITTEFIPAWDPGPQGSCSHLQLCSEEGSSDC